MSRGRVQQVGMEHTYFDGEHMLLTTDHPLYAEVVRQLTNEIGRNAVQRVMDAFGIPSDGTIVPITDQEYERAFRGDALASCTDIVVGAAVADCSLQSILQAVQDTGPEVEPLEPALLPSFGLASDLFLAAIEQEFKAVKREYDSLPQVVSSCELQPQVWVSPVEPYYAGMYHVSGNVVVDGRACYQVCGSDGCVRIVYPVSRLAMEELPVNTLFGSGPLTYDGGYQAMMRVLYGAVYRQFLRRLVAVLAEGPTMLVKPGSSTAMSTTSSVTVSRVGANKVKFDVDDVALVTTGVGNFVDSLACDDVYPRVFRVDGYFPKGKRTYVFADGVFAQTPMGMSVVQALAFSLRRVRDITVVIPGDADLEVVDYGEVTQSVHSVRRALRDDSASFKVLVYLLDTGKQGCIGELPLDRARGSPAIRRWALGGSASEYYDPAKGRGGRLLGGKRVGG